MSQFILSLGDSVAAIKYSRKPNLLGYFFAAKIYCRCILICYRRGSIAISDYISTIAHQQIALLAIKIFNRVRYRLCLLSRKRATDNQFRHLVPAPGHLKKIFFKDRKRKKNSNSRIERETTHSIEQNTNHIYMFSLY